MNVSHIKPVFITGADSGFLLRGGGGGEKDYAHSAHHEHPYEHPYGLASTARLIRALYRMAPQTTEPDDTVFSSFLF